MTQTEFHGGRVVLHGGDCLAVLDALPENSVDSIVTDPPYHLTSIVKRFGGESAAPAQFGTDGLYQRGSVGFMNRIWDGGDIAFRPDTWARVMRVLKPGGHLVAFAATKNSHRMVCAIEDAGFEIRDALQWIYGCLDEETEALTRTGWKRQGDLSESDEVVQWDSETGTLSWTHPTAVLRYAYDGPMVRIKNRHTDQLLTPNHRVYAKIQTHSRNPAPTHFEVREARHLQSNWNVDFPVAGMLRGGEGPDATFAYIVGWWLTDAWRHGDRKAVMFSQCKPATLAKLRTALAPHSPSEYVKAPKKPTHSAEHTFYVNGALAARLIAEHPDRLLTWDVLSWSEEARRAIYEGLMDGDGSQRETQYAHVFWSKLDARRAVFMALAATLGIRVLEDAEKGCVHVNHSTSTTQTQARHHVPNEHYAGTVWCVTVPTGAFMCRRRGGVFITGNSGFPKSLDVSKAIDKAAGAERQKIMVPTKSGNAAERSVSATDMQSGFTDVSEPVTDAARQWEGWGTALKPAFEPICLARKPLSEKTVAANVLRWGTGAINVDGCRIGTEGGTRGADAGPSTGILGDGLNGAFGKPVPGLGRFPANILHDGSDEVVAAFPSTKVNAPSRKLSEHADGGANEYGLKGRDLRAFEGSDGSAARFFYSAKANASERVDAKTHREGASHPTVKPIALMRWLVRLVTPPGGTTLDPFSGTGTTGEAAVLEGMRAVLIEREADYQLDIAERMRRMAPVPGTTASAALGEALPVVSHLSHEMEMFG